MDGECGKPGLSELGKRRGPDAGPLKTPPEGHRCISGVGCNEVEAWDDVAGLLRVTTPFTATWDVVVFFTLHTFIGARWRWNPCDVRVGAVMR